MWSYLSKATLALVLMATPAQGQSTVDDDEGGPVPDEVAPAQTMAPIPKLAWEMAGSTTAEAGTAQTYVYALYVDAMPPVVMLGVSCALVTGWVTCTGTPPTWPTAPGKHTMTLTAGIAGNGTSAKSYPPLTVTVVAPVPTWGPLNVVITKVPPP
jgi:hypothetical protein